jgi:hypothetical protein
LGTSHIPFEQEGLEKAGSAISEIARQAMSDFMASSERGHINVYSEVCRKFCPARLNVGRVKEGT